MDIFTICTSAMFHSCHFVIWKNVPETQLYPRWSPQLSYFEKMGNVFYPQTVSKALILITNDTSFPLFLYWFFEKNETYSFSTEHKPTFKIFDHLKHWPLVWVSLLVMAMWTMNFQISFHQISVLPITLKVTVQWQSPCDLPVCALQSCQSNNRVNFLSF